MRAITAVSAFGLLLGAVAGCSSMRWNLARPPDSPARPTDGKVQAVDSLVEYLNNNAGRVKSLQVSSLEVTCGQGPVNKVNLRGKMVAQTPKSLRMSLDGPLGFNQWADLGSNNDEFWFWIKQPPGQPGQPYQYYCSYEDLKKGIPFLPIPFQPEWIMETLGLGPYGPPERYQLEADAKSPTIRLVERARSPQGNVVRKVIVMNRRETKAPEPQVTHYLLIDDASNKEICSAHITQTMLDPGTGAILPKRLDLVWRQENVTLNLIIDRAAVNVALAPEAFVRRPLSGVQAFNLARGQPDPPGVQRVQGLLPNSKQ
jgi:hypothetical protein